MNKTEFYKYYIPALSKALERENETNEFYTRGPEVFLEIPLDKKREMDLYLDQISGKDDFLDNVAYFFDAKSHGFDTINGIEIEILKKNLEIEILKYRKLYQIS